MVDLIKQNKIIVLVVIVILVAAVWYGMSSSGSAPTTALTSEKVVDSETDQALVDELLKLRAIRLEGAIFSDPAFMSLQDSGVDIVSEPIGRRNPFAPLDGVASSPVGETKPAASSTPATSTPRIPRGGGGEQ